VGQQVPVVNGQSATDSGSRGLAVDLDDLTQAPWHELSLSNSLGFTLGNFARRYRNNQVEQVIGELF